MNSLIIAYSSNLRLRLCLLRRLCLLLPCLLHYSLPLPSVTSTTRSMYVKHHVKNVWKMSYFHTLFTCFSHIFHTLFTCISHIHYWMKTCENAVKNMWNTLWQENTLWKTLWILHSLNFEKISKFRTLWKNLWLK